MNAQRDKGVERILPELDIPKLEVWLTAHEAVRRTPRVDAVWSALIDPLRAACDTPAPP